MEPPSSPLKEGDFVWVASAEAPVHTIYPVRLLKQLAVAILDKAPQGEIKDLCHRVQELSDAQLDCCFVKYFPRIMRHVLYPSEEKMLGLEQDDELFKKLVVPRETRNFLFQTVLVYDKSRYERKVVEYGRFKQELADLSQRIEVWKAENLEEKWKKGIADYYAKERTLLVEQARLLIFEQYLQETSGSRSEQDAKWGEYASSGATSAASYVLDHYLHTRLLTNVVITAANYFSFSATPYVRQKINQMTQQLLNERGIHPDQWTTIPLDPALTAIKASYQFDGLSSGIKKRVWTGGASTTKGILRLEIGPWVFHYDYFLKNTSPLQKLDLIEFQTLLLKALEYKLIKIEQINTFLMAFVQHTPAFLTEIDLDQSFFLLRNRQKIN